MSEEDELERVWKATRAHDDGRRLLLAREAAGQLGAPEAELVRWVGLSGEALPPEEAAALPLPAWLFAADAVVPLATAGPARELGVRARATTVGPGFERLVLEVGGGGTPGEWQAFSAIADEVAALGVRRLVLDLEGLGPDSSPYALGETVARCWTGETYAVCPPRSAQRDVLASMWANWYQGLFDSRAAALTAPPWSPPKPPVRADGRAPGERSPDPAPPDWMAWILRLARWGPAPCLALALELGADEPESEQRGVARRWLEEPSSAWVEAARQLDPPRLDPLAEARRGRSAPTWGGVACRVLAWGAWHPPHVTWLLGASRPAPARVRRALLPLILDRSWPPRD